MEFPLLFDFDISVNLFPMIWFAIQGIILLFSFLISRPKPSKSSFGILSHLDSNFLHWIDLLERYSIIDNKIWRLKCPSYLSGCCLPIKAIENDGAISSQLSHMTPFYGFLFLLIRRIAELIISVATFCLPVLSLLSLAYGIWLTFQKNTSIMQYKYSKHVRRRNGPKRFYFFASLLPLSIIVPFIVEMIYGGVLEYQLQNNSRSTVLSYLSLSSWATWRDKEPPSISFNLFTFPGLMQTLFVTELDGSLSKISAKEKLCLQTSMSLAYWAVLVFLSIVYLLALLLCKVLVIYPLKCIYWAIFSDDTDHYHVTNEIHNKNRAEYCNKKILDPRDRRSRKPDFTINLPINKDFSNCHDKLMEEFDKFEYPDPEFLFNAKGDSHCNLPLETTTQRSRIRRPESGDYFEAHSIPERMDNSLNSTNKSSAAKPQYVSTGTYACFDSSDYTSSSEESEDS